jgi:type II secretory pathway pseudopilin PulG
VLVVVVIIGILAALGWSSMNELIQTNKAKEAARTITAFAERAVADSKMRKDSVKISINASNAMEARLAFTNELLFSQPLANGFSVSSSLPSGCTESFNGGITSRIRIGISGVGIPGCFVVCNASNYCGGAVKTGDKNTFTAQIKRKNSNAWEEI